MELSMGLLGEQGAESIRAKFNHIERAYSSVKKGRLLRVVQEHYITIDQENIVLTPAVKKENSTKTKPLTNKCL